jgi:hypothetical protein
MAKRGNLANFKGKRAAPFAKRKSGATSRKKSSTKTARGTKKKVKR